MVNETHIPYVYSGEVLSAAIILPIMGIFVVGLRFRVRSRRDQGIRADDWLIFAALFFEIGMGICLIWGKNKRPRWSGDTAEHGQGVARKSVGYPSQPWPVHKSSPGLEALTETTPKEHVVFIVYWVVWLLMIPANGLIKTEVIHATESSGAELSWKLEIRRCINESDSSFISCAKLIIATGQASIPKDLNLNGLQKFSKPVIHSVDLGECANSLLNDRETKSVTILGGSKSAHDSVSMFAAAGKHVTWLIHQAGCGRRPVPMSKPYLYVGSWPVWAEGILLLRPLTWFGAAPWSDGDGFSWIRSFLHSTKLGNFIVKSYFEQTSKLAGSQSGILDDDRTKVLIPDSNMLWYGTQLNVLNYDEDFYKLIRDGKVSIVQGELDYLIDDTIVLKDQRKIRTSALVCAIGYDYSASVSLEPASRRLSWGCPIALSEDRIYPELDARADKELLARFPMLKKSPQQQDRPPLFTPWRLWRFLAPPSQVPSNRTRNIVFLNAINCYQTTVKTELTSLWAYAYLYGRLAAPSPSEDEAQYEVALWTRFGKWRAPYGMQGKSADFFHDAMPYYDLLMRDLGLRSWRKGWGFLGEIFGGRYEVHDYEGIVHEWILLQERRAGKHEKSK